MKRGVMNKIWDHSTWAEIPPHDITIALGGRSLMYKSKSRNLSHRRYIIFYLLQTTNFTNEGKKKIYIYIYNLPNDYLNSSGNSLLEKSSSYGPSRCHCWEYTGLLLLGILKDIFLVRNLKYVTKSQYLCN